MATNIPGKHLDVIQFNNVLTTVETRVLIPDARTLRYIRMETHSGNHCRWSRTPNGTFSPDNWGCFRQDTGRFELKDVELQPMDADGCFFWIRGASAAVDVEVVYMQ